jgi:hypothetical protein
MLQSFSSVISLLLCSTKEVASAAPQWTIVTDLPAEQPAAFDQWVAHIQQGSSPAANIQIAVELTMLIEAANRSAAENRPVRLDELAVG